MKHYLVRDWTDIEKDSEPKDKMVNEDEIWGIVQEAKDNLAKIAIFEVGECLIDWS